MTDSEIYYLAQSIASSITGDLAEGIYKELKGTLSIIWKERPRKFNAWAESKAPINEPPEHKIGINFELALLMYRDAEAFCDFAGSNLATDAFKPLFENSDTIPSLPSGFSKEDCAKNIFIAAFTWVYFHELGHAIQEHGYIRHRFGGQVADSQIVEECDANATEDDSNATNRLTGKAAALSHTMELAADFEATSYCIFELLRHFVFKEEIDENIAPSSMTLEDLVAQDYDVGIFKDILYLFVCGLSCVFYRFHGLNNLSLQDVPEGSHPNPIIRMEINLPHLYEYFDLPAIREMTKHEMRREDLVRFLTTAANSAAIFWIHKKTDSITIPNNYFLIGLGNRPEIKNYFQIIVSTWDEIKPTIESIRRFGAPFGLLQFTPVFRQIVLG